MLPEGISRRILLRLAMLCGLLFSNGSFAAINYWCDEPGNPQHPLSIEQMSKGALLSPEIRKNPGKAMAVIIEAFNKAQSELPADSATTLSHAEVEAFKKLLDKQSAGNNLLPHFRFTLKPTGNVELIWPDAESPIEFDCVDDIPQKLEQKDRQKTNIAYVSYLVTSVTAEQLSALDKIYDDKVANRAKQYEDFMNNGLPMWPWELVVNSWGENYEDLMQGAPKWQWVFARPSAGFEVFWPKQEDANIEASVGIEPIGFVRYHGKQYRKWWGISALATLGTDDSGAAFGGLFRYNNYALGIVKRKDIDDVYLFFSIDLYDRVREGQTRVEEAKERLDELKQSWLQ